MSGRDRGRRTGRACRDWGLGRGYPQRECEQAGQDKGSKNCVSPFPCRLRTAGAYLTGRRAVHDAVRFMVPPGVRVVPSGQPQYDHGTAHRRFLAQDRADPDQVCAQLVQIGVRTLQESSAHRAGGRDFRDKPRLTRHRLLAENLTQTSRNDNGATSMRSVPGVRTAWALCLILLTAGLSALTLSAASADATVTTTLQPVADSYVWAKSPDTSFGSETSIKVSAVVYRGLLKFDTSGLSPDNTISSADLKLYVTKGPAVGGIQIHPLSDGWTESTTWASLLGGIRRSWRPRQHPAMGRGQPSRSRCPR